MTQNWAMPQPPTLLAINIDAADATKNYAATLTLTGDARTLTARLTAACAENTARRRAVRDRNAELATEITALIRAEEPAALELLGAVERSVPQRTALVLDMCMASYWLSGFARVGAQMSLLYSMGWGTLGYSLPAGLGAACAGVERAVVFIGDGGFLFATGELAAVNQIGMPLTIVVVDDGAYGMLKYDQISKGMPVRGVELVSPDFVAVAAAFGIQSARVDGFGERFEALLREFSRSPRPNLIAVSSSMAPPPTSSSRWYRAKTAATAS
jgi:acetolactate synthase-1/2/3 large subunit